MSGLYLHIPFCKQACSYCDFYFVTRKQEKSTFVAALIEEIHSKRDSLFVQEPIETIYFGGGTPSLLSVSEIEQILNAIRRVFEVQASEITLEMNPDDVNAAYLQGLHDVGINRASMGVQSFNTALLSFMHRAHSRDEALRSFEYLAASPIKKFTVDLIYGNPKQTEEMLGADLELLKTFDPPHVSAYSLTIEPGTRLGKQVELGRLLAPDDDIVARHFDIVVRELSAMGIEQYEVSNYAKPGKEAIHNSAYWTHKNYLGLGPSAHSFWWNAEVTSARRWSNPADLKAYEVSNHRKTEEVAETLTLPELAEERLMLALRTVKGISFKELEHRYAYTLSEEQQRYLHRKVNEGKVRLSETGFHLTPEGLKVSDAILLDLITI